MIAILAFAVINKYWGIAFFCLGLIAIGLNYLLKNAYTRSDITTYDISGVFYHVSVYTISLFGFISYLLFLFEKYLRLYLQEMDNSRELNGQLEKSIELLNIVNSDLELHIRAL